MVYMPEEDWILVDGIHEAIIPWERWQEAQKRRKQRYVPPSNTGQRANPFAGLIVCSQCGNKMQRMLQHKGQAYLLCTTKGCCAGAKFDFVEEHMYELLREKLEELQLRIAEGAAADTSSLETQLNSVTRELEKVKARIPRLYEFLEDGTYDRPTFRQRLEAVEKEVSGLAQRQADIQKEIDERRAHDPRETAAALENLLQLYPTLSPAEKNTMLKSIVDHVTYTKYKKTKPRDFTLELKLIDF